MDDHDDAFYLSQIPPQQKSYMPAKTIGSAVRKWMVKNGVADVQAAELTRQQWKLVVGDDLIEFTRPGKVQRGVLYVSVSNSLVLQELHLQKRQILTSLRERLPEFKIRDLRFRVESV